MSITHELREYFGKSKGMFTDHVLAIADRIDAEHETTELQKESYRLDLKAANFAVGEAYKRGFDEGFASADDWLAQHEDAMVEHGWVRLPKDADGEPICVGDVMEGEKVGGGFCEPFEVVGYIMSNGELEPMDEHKCPRKRRYLRHHHEPTVEDVLREFAEGLGVPVADSYVAATAAKLRLAEGED